MGKRLYLTEEERLEARRKAWRRYHTKKRGGKPPRRYTKYASKEERIVANKAREKARHAADPDRTKRWREQNPERAITLKRTYTGRRIGWTLEMATAALERQGSRCAICATALDLECRSAQPGCCRDHDHSTGKARALLCQACNRALGLYERYQRAAVLRLEAYEDYISKHL